MEKVRLTKEQVAEAADLPEGANLVAVRPGQNCEYFDVFYEAGGTLPADNETE